MTHHLLAPLCLALLGPVQLVGQELAVDHFWIRVSPGAPEARVLEDAGFRFHRFDQASSIAPTASSDPRVVQHQGQGTASMIVRFRNAYLELIWVEDPDLLRQIARDHGYTLLEPDTSPIGLGLRHTGEDAPTLPFESTSHWAAWMRPNVALATARRDPGALGEPAIFVIPQYLRWDLRTQANPDLLEWAEHGSGVGDVTRIRVMGRGLTSESEAVSFLEERRLVEFEPSQTDLLEIEFDGQRDSMLDLRPELPLIIYH